MIVLMMPILSVLRMGELLSVTVPIEQHVGGRDFFEMKALISRIVEVMEE